MEHARRINSVGRVQPGYLLSKGEWATVVSQQRLRLHDVNQRETKYEEYGSPGFNQCISVICKTMAIVGVWPTKETTGLLRQFHFIFPEIMMVFFIIIPQTRRAIHSHNDLSIVIEVLCTCDLACIIALMKHCGLWYNKQALRKILMQISKDWKITTAEEQSIMWTNARIGKMFGIFCISTTMGSVLVHSIIYVRKIMLLEAQNASHLRPTYFVSYFPFETNYSPMFEIICFCQVIAVTTVSTTFASFDGFFASSILHFSGQLFNLRKRIINLIEEHNMKNETFTITIKSVVNKHQHIVCAVIQLAFPIEKSYLHILQKFCGINHFYSFSYTNMIEDHFNKIFLAQMLCSSVFLCLQGYQFVVTITDSSVIRASDLVFSLVYLTSNLVSLFLYCYVAEVVKNESEDLYRAVYEMQWYKLLPNDMKLLLIIMRRFMSPVEITVGKFGVLSLQYFSSIVKTSVGYMSVLIAVKDNRN